MRVRLVLALSAALIPGVGMLGAESAQGGGGRGPEAPARRAPTASAVWAPRTRGGPAAAGGRLVLTTAPPLRPGFQPADPDYTVACARRRMVDIHARVPRGERLSINGHAATTSIHERIPLAAGVAPLLHSMCREHSTRSKVPAKWAE